VTAAEHADAPHERAWTLPAAAGLAAVEATVAIAVLLYHGHFAAGMFIVVLAAKYPICWALLRRQAWAFIALMFWELTVMAAALWAPGTAFVLRVLELSSAAGVLGLLFASLHLFPSAQLPRR
jgi:hypothetical protein